MIRNHVIFSSNLLVMYISKLNIYCCYIATFMLRKSSCAHFFLIKYSGRLLKQVNKDTTTAI